MRRKGIRETILSGGMEMKRYVLIGLFLLSLGWWSYDTFFSAPDPVQPMTAEVMPEPAPQPYYVYVTGAVAKPGLYSFSDAVRAGEAVAAAGNVVAYGDVSAVNLAEPVVDGQHIHIPYDVSGAPNGSVEDDGLISINQADEKKLTDLPGIGPSMAKRIIEYRQEKGAFTAIEELQQVKGIGPAKFKDLQDKVKL